MNYLESVLLGIIQGFTEFLPISSSGHLEIGKTLFGNELVGEEGLFLTLVLHLGTALSTTIVFRKEIQEIFNSLLENSNTHISKRNLLQEVWSYNQDIDTHTLETHIYSLRKKIEKNLLIKDLIVFEENKGYFLNTKIL